MQGRFVNRPYGFLRKAERYLRHSEERRDAPQGGLSCPFGAIHLLGISWYCVRARRVYQEIATGLRPRNDIMQSDNNSPEMQALIYPLAP